MIEIDIPKLQLLGLKPALLQQWLANFPGYQPWRISAVNRGICQVISAPSEQHAEPNWSGQFVSSVANVPQHSCPAVGDWVFLEPGASDGPYEIIASLERNTWLRRGSVDGRSRPQEIAANLDTVFIVSAFATTEKLLSRALNPRKIERFIAAVSEGRANAVVVLNKLDLCEDSEPHLQELGQRLGGVPLLRVSAQQGIGVEQLEPWLAPGESIAFVGSSGVGKSTLINRVLNSDEQRTAEVRSSDTKGKHTTTRRQMLLAPSGALLIDTPGIRELAVFSAQGESLGFDDIEELAGQCRFSDCDHETEPDCAVKQAIEQGQLHAERLHNYNALKRDALRQRARHDALARHQQHKAFRQFEKMVRNASKSKLGRE